MSGKAAANEAERALPPPGPAAVDLPRWGCTACDFSVPGTIDEPYTGDGTCPYHADLPLMIRRGTPDQSPAG